MPSQASVVVSRPPSPPRSKPHTRSSIRQSLNLASKAFVEAINKDIKEPAKASKKTKDSRRSSAVPAHIQPPPITSAPRTSMGDITIRPPSQTTRRTNTPDHRIGSSRRRVSSSSFARTSSEEQSQRQHTSSDKPTPTSSSRHEQSNTPPSAVHIRSAGLRPKNPNNGSSLPKLRVKSAKNKEEAPLPRPTSPARTGQRRRHEASDDEKKEQRPSTLSPAEKNARPISPLPHRAALKQINATPPATPPKPKAPLATSANSSARLSPSRPTKIVKVAPAVASAIPRPPSSNSSGPPTQSISTPKSAQASTPKASVAKEKFTSRTNLDVKTSPTPSKMLPPTFNRSTPSPLSRHFRTGSTKITPHSSSASTNISRVSERINESEDSDAEDVELLLAPVANPEAPTPAMPRIQVPRKRLNPKTPSKANTLPSRENLSYLSPPAPSSDPRPSHLRPSGRPNLSVATRGSILSWEQIAAEASKTLGEDEFGRMLADVPAPFRSGAVSPSLSSQIGVPESPCLSAIDSPSGGYGSISQVLLPDVTPSPAVNHHIQNSRFSLTPEASATAVDSSTATMLRLQLAAMENTAKERLRQMQAMEEELHNLKQAHGHQVEEMQKQVQYMEAQGRVGEQRVEKKFQGMLQEQLAQQQAVQERSFQETLKRFRNSAEAEHAKKVEAQRRRLHAKECAGLAASRWGAVASACEVELDSVRSDKAMLSFLLAQVDQMARVL